jgi:hypothetical protein
MEAIVASLSSEFLASLTAAPIARSVIAAEMGTTASVSMALGKCARGMTPPHLVERHSSTGEIKYGLRPTKPGEVPGQVKEAG